MQIVYFCLMKKLLILSFIISISIGCKKLNKLTQFNLDYESSFTVPSSTGISVPFIMVSPDMETNSSSTFESNDTRKDLIEVIELRKLRIEIDSPPSQTFNFLKSINIYINADGLDEIKLAFKTNIQNTNSKSLDLDVSHCDFQEYIKKDKFTLRVQTVTDEFLSQDVDFTAYSQFFVDAKLIK